MDSFSELVNINQFEYECLPIKIWKHTKQWIIPEKTKELIINSVTLSNE